MNNRVNKVRLALDLSMDKFGSRIGLTRSAISKIESGSSKPSEQTIVSICREFNVNEEWLRSGTGEMFKEIVGNDEIATYVYGLLQEEDTPMNALIIEIMRTYYKLDSKSQAVIDGAISDFVSNIQKKKRD